MSLVDTLRYCLSKGWQCVAPEVDLRECTLHLPPSDNVNKAEPTLGLKPRVNVTRNPKQGYRWPQNRTCEFILFWERRIIFIGLKTVHIYCISSSEWYTSFFKAIRISVRQKSCHWSIQKMCTTHYSGIQHFTNQRASSMVHSILNSQSEAITRIMF